MSDPRIVNDPTKLKPRLTIVESISHQSPQKQPKAVTSRFARQLDTHEQVYERELTATEEWQPLIPKGCWLDNCSLVHVQNEEGRHLAANPTDEERRATAAKVLEIGRDIPDWYIPQGETFHGSPMSFLDLSIRCQVGTADFTLTVFPR